MKDAGVERGFNLSPNVITVDFETGLIPALQTEFPMARLRGCYFHFCQAIYREVQQQGLSRKYANDDATRKHIRLLLALAFVPINDVAQV